MENLTVTLQSGALQLPNEVQQTLALEEGARRTVPVGDRGVFNTRATDAISQEAALRAIADYGVKTAGHIVSIEFLPPLPIQ